MKRIFSAIILSSFFFITAAAQVKLPSRCEAFLPNALFNSVLSESETDALAASSDFGQKNKPAVMKYWEVYSDRNNNKTYTSPGGNEVFTELAFNERLRIAQIKGKFALVYSDPIGTYPEITQYAEPKGWISMDNLLLWNSCPADDKGIYYKALICYNMSTNTENKSELAGYENPMKQGRSFPLNTDLKFYFIMKRVKDMVLLASEYTLSGESDKVLYAWVPEGAYVPWNQRSCLELTWEKEDVAYFAAKSIAANVCIDKDLKQALTSFTFPEHQGGESDRYFYRTPPQILRFPILDGSTDALYEVSSFGSLGGKTTVAIGGNQAETPTETSIKQAALDKLSKLNLVIVIDGTSSMEKYFPAVKEAITKGSEFFSSQHYDMKVGVVIYRDYSDGEAGLTEVYPMSKPDDSGLANFIYSGGKYGIRSAAADRTHTEAVYYGIQEGMKLFSDPKESNIMLVVGDCGNDPEDTKVTMDYLVDNLFAKNVNFMGFQVRNNDIFDWTVFNNQMVQIMRKSTQKKYDALLPGTKVTTKMSLEGYELVNDANSAIYVGAHKYALDGTELSESTLTELMIGSIRQVAEAVQHQKDVVVSFDSRRSSIGGSNEVVDVAAKLDSALVVQQIGEENMKAIDSNTMISFRGWVKKTDETGKKLFKPVLFISDKEFQSLLERLAPVNDAAKTNQREPYINAMKALIRSLVPDITNEELDRQGIDKTMKLIAGLNEKSDALKDYTLLEISSRHSVPDDVFTSLVRSFTRKFTTLERIKKDDYKYVREFNGIKYYWIPMEQLP